MSFIDWSDAHEMLGLLAEYVADERLDSGGEPERERFLAELLEELRGVIEDIDESTDHDLSIRLRGILESVPGEWRDDPVLDHLQACIEEIERIRDRVGP